MPLRLRCPGCKTSMRIPDSARGKRVKCPECENLIRIPKEKDASAEPRKTKTAPTVPTSEQTSEEPRLKPARTNLQKSIQKNQQTATAEPPVSNNNSRWFRKRGLLIGGGLLGLIAAALAIVKFTGPSGEDSNSTSPTVVAQAPQTSSETITSQTPETNTTPVTESPTTQPIASVSPPTETKSPETPPPERPTGSVAVFNAVHRSVVNLESRMGNGTGIILNRDGLILTNAHVIEGTATFKCRLDALKDGEQQTLIYSKVVVVGIHPGRDLALVKIDTTEHDAELQPARIKWDKAVAGERIFAIGNPSTPGDVTLSKTITEGLVSGVERRVQGQTYYQISAPINPGNSGGPITNQHGDVLGVVTLSMLFASDVGFAIPLHDLDLSRFVPPQRRKGNRKLSETKTDGGIKIQQSYYSLVTKKLHKTQGGRLSFSLAMRQLQDAVVTDPTNWRPYLFIGRLLASQDRYIDAELYLRQSLELDPWNNISSYETLGRTMNDHGYPERAVPIWREGVARFPLAAAEIWGSLARYHANKNQLEESAFCAAAALYSMHTLKRTQGYAPLTQLLESTLNKIKDPAAAQRARSVCYGMKTVITHLNEIAKQHSKLRTIAMRQDFFEVAQQIGLELRGGPNGAMPKTKPLPNGLLEYPPPGVESVVDTVSIQIPTPATFPTMSGEPEFSESAIGTIVDLSDSKTDKPPWMTPPKVVVGSPQPGSTNRPGIPASTPAPTTTVEPVVSQVSPIAQRDVREFRLSPNGGHLVVVDNYKIQVWDRSGEVKWKPFDGHQRARHVAAFSSDGKVATSDSKQTLIWDLETHEVQQSIGDDCEIAAFTADNDRFLTVGSSINLWSCKNGQRLKEIRTRYIPKSLGLSADDSQFAAGGSMGQFGLFNTEDGKPVTQWTLKGDGFSRGFIVDHGTLTIMIHIKLVQIADTKSGKIIFRHNFRDSLSGCAATPDGRTLVFTHPHYASILDFSDRNKPRWISAPYGKRAYHSPECSFSSDGKVMATTARDQKAIEIWDIEAMLQQGAVKHEAMNFNNKLWAQIIPTDATPSADDIAKMQQICDSQPTHVFLNTLGLALFRAGQFEETIVACTASVQAAIKAPTMKGKPLPGDYLLIAMSHAKLGELDQAGDFRVKAETLINGTRSETDPEIIGFREELAALLK